MQYTIERLSATEGRIILDDQVIHYEKPKFMPRVMAYGDEESRFETFDLVLDYGNGEKVNLMAYHYPVDLRSGSRTHSENECAIFADKLIGEILDLDEDQLYWIRHGHSPKTAKLIKEAKRELGYLSTNKYANRKGIETIDNELLEELSSAKKLYSSKVDGNDDEWSLWLREKTYDGVSYTHHLFLDHKPNLDDWETIKLADYLVNTIKANQHSEQFELEGQTYYWWDLPGETFTEKVNLLKTSRGE